MIDDRTLEKLAPYVYAAGVAQVVGLIGVAALSNVAPNSDVEQSFNGMLDLPGKHYAAAALDGAATGMKENGWSNFSIERRLDVMREAMNPDFSSALEPVYDQAYEQGLAGEWDEAALDGYLQVVEMPGRHIHHFNKSTLEGDEVINPEALRAKIDAEYGTQWDAVGQHFREGLEGMILTTVTATEYAKEILNRGTLEFEVMESPVRYAAEVHGFMTSGPNDPVLKADGPHEVEDVLSAKVNVEDPFTENPVAQNTKTNDLDM